jgi:hypothetical protein
MTAIAMQEMLQRHGTASRRPRRVEPWPGLPAFFEEAFVGRVNRSQAGVRCQRPRNLLLRTATNALANAPPLVLASAIHETVTTVNPT